MAQDLPNKASTCRIRPTNARGRTSATWDPSEQSLEWYGSERFYALKLSGFVTPSDGENLSTAKELALIVLPEYAKRKTTSFASGASGS